MAKGNNPSIVLENLGKTYPKAVKPALDNVSIKVHPSEVYGFLGPNGAGKSTAIRILMNFLQPSSGKASILGRDVAQESVSIKKDVGYLSGDISIYPKMTGRQYLEYMGSLQPPKSKAYLNELAKRFKADLNKKLGELSRGNRQKIGILQAFMHQPKILILDEPTSGLDPLMQEEFYKLVSESKKNGSSIFISSHILSEIQRMCDRVGIIREGKLITERSIKEMSTEAAQNFDIKFKSKPPLSSLRKIKGVKIIDAQENSVNIHVHGELSPLFAVLSKHDVIGIDAHNLDLEEVFLGFYQDKGIGK